MLGKPNPTESEDNEYDASGLAQDNPQTYGIESKPAGKLDASHLDKDLQETIVRGGKATLSAQAISFVLSMVSTAILARLLSPADFGLIAMVTAVTGVVTIFKDGGLSIATIQRDTVSDAQVSNLFWINIALSLLLALVIAAMAPAISWFYGEPKLQGITLVIAGIFFIGGMTAQHGALLSRQMRFSDLAKIRIRSLSLGTASAIIAAWAGAGYWALLIQMATVEAFGVLLTWTYCRWQPARPQRGQGTLSMLHVGGHVTLLGIFNYLGRNADNLLLGRYWGSQAVGLYSKAYGLLMLPIQQISSPIAAVAMPALSRLQGHPQEYRAFFRKILTVSCFTSFPLIAWMIICCNDIILLVLGPSWLKAAPIFLALAISALCQPIGNLSSLLYVTLGRTKSLLCWGIVGNIWLVIGMLIGLRHGVMGVALGYSVATVLMMPPLIMFSISGTFVSLRDCLDPLIIPFFAVFLASLFGWIAHNLFASSGYLLVRLAVVSLSIALVYLAIVYKARPRILKIVRDVLFGKL